MHDLHHAVGLWNGVEKRRKSNSRHKGCGMDGADNEVVASLDFREKGRRVAFVTEGSYMAADSLSPTMKMMWSILGSLSRVGASDL